MIRTSPRAATASVALLALVGAITGCGAEPAVPTADEVMARTHQQLLADGVDEETAQCVLDLARRRLRTGPLPDLAREELVDGCRAARDGLAAAQPDEPNDDLAFTGPNARGDDPTLDRLWDGCADGDGGACDQLFEDAPLGSDYERFGLTCGDRPDVVDCTDLDADAVTADPTNAATAGPDDTTGAD